MKNRWDQVGAAAAVRRYRGACGEDLALRVYSSRLIGADSNLVLHGGGNTSVKSITTNLLGESVETLFVKGSGWNLGTIEPAGFSPVDLAWVRRLRGLETLSDEEMVNALRTHLFDAKAPNPSVETLLHAFLPHRFIDHSHADAILALTNLEDGVAHVRAALGDELALVPYVMPGFELSLRAAEAYEAAPDSIGLVLLKHGLFTYGDSAEESYRRHIEVVQRAEDYLAARSRVSVAVVGLAQAREAGQRAAELGPYLRKALAEEGDGRAWILHWRANDGILDFVNGPELQTMSASGPLTPDHVIRTKRKPLVLSGPITGASVRAEVAGYCSDYRDYFDRESASAGGDYTRLDPVPRVVLVPGVGMVTVGKSVKDAEITADIYEHTMKTKRLAAVLGPYSGLGADKLFEMEYWSLEQAKLGRSKEPLLGRKVALVTGAAGAIGLGVARVLLEAGVHLVLADIDAEALERVSALLDGGPMVRTVSMDVRSADSVRAGFDVACQCFGGIDFVVANAGVAVVGAIDTLEEEAFERVMAVNLNGTWLTIREGARLLKRQQLGGHMVIISSKNVMGPGVDFGAYSASKAGGHQLGKIAAMELASEGIRVNMVTPDAVFGDGDVPSGLWREVGPDRARSKGLAPESLAEHYQQRNLLKTRVTGEDVGRAVLFFFRGDTPTTGATLPVDGGVVAAFPR